MCEICLADLNLSALDFLHINRSMVGFVILGRPRLFLASVSPVCLKRLWKQLIEDN